MSVSDGVIRNSHLSGNWHHDKIDLHQSIIKYFPCVSGEILQTICKYFLDIISIRKSVQNCTNIVKIKTWMSSIFQVNGNVHGQLTLENMWRKFSVYKVWNYWGVSECCSGVLSCAMSVSVAGVSASDWSPASPSRPLIGYMEDTNHCQDSAEMRRPRLVTGASSDETA